MSETDRPAPRVTVPWGLIGTLVLVTLAEGALAWFRDDLSHPIVAGYRYAAASVWHASGRDVLCFGDSLVKFGVMPRVLADRNVDAFNLGCPGARAPLTYLLFARSLAAGARPSAVLVDFKPTLIQEDPLLDAVELSEVLTLRECLELAATCRDPLGIARLALHRLLPSLSARRGLRALAGAVLKRRPWPAARERARRMVENWDGNLGAWVVDKNPNAGRAEPFPDEAMAVAMSPWSCHPTNAAYVRKFLDLASRHGIAVYWLIPPITPRLLAERDRLGDDARFSAYVQEVSADYPCVTVVDARRAAYPAKVFLDGSHLDVEGAFTYSVALASLIRDGCGAGSTSRRVDLPRFSPRPEAKRLVGRSTAGGGTRR